MHIKNPFHRATQAEKHAKNLNEMKGEGRSLQAEIRHTKREINKAMLAKKVAQDRGNFPEAKASLIEAKKLEKHLKDLDGSKQFLSEVSRTVRLVQTQAVVNTGINRGVQNH